MLQEQAQVVSVEGEYALVQTRRQSACESCSVNKGCGTSVLAKAIGRPYIRLRLLNRCQAQVGDTVLVGMPESGMLKSALWVYCLPLILAVLSVALAQSVLGSQVHEMVLFVIGILGLLMGMLLSKWRARHLSEQADFQPVMLSINKTPIPAKQSILIP